MTLLSQGRLGERWGEFMVDGCSDLSVPASQELCVPNPLTVRPQGIIAACYLQEKCLAFSRGRLDWIAAA